MYREAATRDPKETPPTELVYVAVDRDSRRKPAVALLQMFTLPFVVGVALAMITTPTLGLVGAVLSGGLGLWWWRRTPKEGAVLRVEGNELRVLSRSSLHEKARFRLFDLVNVALDTKTIRPVQEGASAIPAMRFIDSQVGAEVDTARIMLVGREGPSVLLSDAYVAHMEATEWLGKIRVFLRKQGWVPEDEREVASEP